MGPAIMVLSSLLNVVNYNPTAPTSKDRVKITVKAEKPADGKRVVLLTLEIAEGWHLLANPVGHPDLVPEQTRVSFTSSGKPVEAKIEYPVATRVIKDEVVGDYAIYEGTIKIRATVAQADDLEAILWVRAYNERGCILPSKVKLKLEP
jgi:hypothetical protein